MKNLPMKSGSSSTSIYLKPEAVAIVAKIIKKIFKTK